MSLRSCPKKFLAGAVGVVLAVAATASVMLSAPVAASSPFVIGFGNPLTGSEATYGVSDEHAVDMAASQINKSGGVDGHQVKIDACDTQGTPAIGVACANSFVSDHVNAVVGFFNSDISIPASAILHTANIPMVSAASTSPTLTEQGFNNVFRVCGTDNYQGEVEADFAYKELHVKRAVALNDEETYGQGVASFFSQNFKKLGGKVLESEGINADATDFTSVLTQIKSLSPSVQVIEFGGFNPAAGLLVKQAHGLGLDVPFISDDGVIGPLYYQTGGQATVGSYLSSSPTPQNLAQGKGAIPQAKTFLKDYVKQFGQPTQFAGYSYEAVEVIAQAAEHEHSISADSVIKGLAATHSYHGATGVVDFDSIGNNITPQYLIYKVKPGGGNLALWNPNAKA